MAGRLPTFLIIGAQKSATTSLINYLGAHPEVFALTEEVHYFDRFYERGIDWYRERFAGAEPAVAVGESTPNYMYFQEAPARMARHLPETRLVAILRDPVDRAYSHYWHNRARGLEELEFQEALLAEPARLVAAQTERLRGLYAYVERGRYLPQLLRVCDHFPREALEVVLYEDLRDERVPLVRSLYTSLGVDDSFVPPNIGSVKNRFMTFRSMRLRRPIRRLPRPLRRVAARLNMRYVRYPPLPRDTGERLREAFREDNRALARWLGQDLRKWEL